MAEKCSACGALLGAGDQVCGACGVTVAGATASFDPVGAATRLEEGATESIGEGPALVVRKGPETGERFYIDRPLLTVGRDPDADIFLNDMTVSRGHARLELRDGNVYVVDAGSLNGTYVNGQCADEALLSDGDVVQIGTFQMVFISGEAPGR